MNKYDFNVNEKEIRLQKENEKNTRNLKVGFPLLRNDHRKYE